MSKPNNSTEIQVNETTQKASWQVDKGQERARNEDNVRVATVQLGDEEDGQAMGVYAVADGAGGHPAGNVASRITAYTATRQLTAHADEASEEWPPDYQEWLHNAVSLANRVLVTLNRKQDTRRDMLTTLVLAAVVGNEAHIVNVGDSRAYVIQETGIHQITKDHSFAQLLVDEEVIQPEDAADHPRKNVLTQAMGQDRLTADLYGVTLKDDDYLLLCSDGLWGELDDDQIWQIVRQSASVQTACQNLVDAANIAGGQDNIAVVLVQINNQPKKYWLRQTAYALGQKIGWSVARFIDRVGDVVRGRGANPDVLP